MNVANFHLYRRPGFCILPKQHHAASPWNVNVSGYTDNGGTFSRRRGAKITDYISNIHLFHGHAKTRLEYPVWFQNINKQGSTIWQKSDDDLPETEFHCTAKTIDKARGIGAIEREAVLRMVSCCSWPWLLWKLSWLATGCVLQHLNIKFNERILTWNTLGFFQHDRKF